MYEAFYGLKERPFNLTPDPKFLYLSDKHKEAFAHLLFGIKNRSGFVMVTGEIGTGKTTICRNLINQLNQDVNLALIFNPSLNPVELMQKINAEFGIEHQADNVRELVDLLNAYLLEQAALDRSCVLIIDEAQNLAPAVLEQIRLLSNLETETEKLLQIILIGQPELAEKLALHELRQLNQRITARYHLKPLDQKETYNYIHYRLHVAGGRRKLKFTPAAVRAIFKHSQGTPRVINAVSDRCLLIGYTKETHIITPRITRQAIRELRGTYRDSAKDLRRRLARWMPSPPMLVMAAVALIALGVAGMIFSEPIRDLARELGAFNRILAGETPAAVAPDAATETSAAPEQPASPASTPAATTPPAPPALANVLDTIAKNNAASRPSEPPLAERLLRFDAAESLASGTAALLAAWNIPLDGAYPNSAEPAAINEFARRHGLSVEYLRPALDQLLAINLPALVRTGTESDARWLALIGATDRALTLVGAKGERIETTREVFAPLFAKEAVVLWKDANPRGPALLPGRTGRAVADFKAQLRTLGRIRPQNTSDQYDQETATAVSRIQSETGLLLDGMAGKQVRMVMQSWSGGAEVPRLSPKNPGQVAALSAPPAPSSTDIVQPPAEPKPAAPQDSETAPLPDWPVAQPTLQAAEPSAPEASPAVDPAPEAAPPPAATETAPAAPGAGPEAAPGAASTETPAVTTDAALVQVENLPEPVEGAFVPEVDDSRKETTPPLNGSAPLVPAGD